MHKKTRITGYRHYPDTYATLERENPGWYVESTAFVESEVESGPLDLYLHSDGLWRRSIEIYGTKGRARQVLHELNQEIAELVVEN